MPRPEARRNEMREVPAGAEPAATPPPPSPGPSRLEELGRMTAGVAHDFNNILSVIMVCASELAADTADPAQLERVEEIREAAERGAELSRRLLAHERPADTGPELIEADRAIAETMPLLRRTLGEEVVVTLGADSHLPRVRLARGELARMLVNLAANSRDAMPAGGGAVAIRTAQVHIPSSDPCLGAGLHVRISFSDNGSGMSPEIARQAIQPHFTTKRAAGGTGLGLATVHSLTRTCGGDLRINTAPGAGTTVSIYLPGVDDSGEPLALDPPGNV